MPYGGGRGFQGKAVPYTRSRKGVNSRRTRNNHIGARSRANRMRSSVRNRTRRNGNGNGN